MINQGQGLVRASATEDVMATTPPRLVMTDGGPEYQSVFQERLAKLGIGNHLIIAHRPQSNVVAEKAVGLVKKELFNMIAKWG